MRRIDLLRLAVASLTFAASSAISFLLANEGKVAFLEPAQKQGRLTVDVHYTRADGSKDSCEVVTPEFAKDTPADTKAQALSTAINQQCTSEIRSSKPEPGAVSVTSKEGITITEIDFKEDGTNQSKTINPASLDDDKLSIWIRLEGTPSAGTALLRLDDCGASSSTPVAGKTGHQVAQELVAGLTNCYPGSTIQALNYGGGIGGIALQGLRATRSRVTIDGGGEFGLSTQVIVEAPFAAPETKTTRAIPALSTRTAVAFATLLAALALWRIVWRS